MTLEMITMRKKQFVILKVFVLISLLSAYSVAQKQTANKKQPKEPQSIRAGEKLPRITLIQPHIEHYISFIARNDKKQILSLLTRTIKLTGQQQNGKSAFSIEQRYESPAGTDIDTSIVSRETLEPLAYRSELSTHNESFDFTSTRVTGTITPKQGDAKTFDEKLETPVFNAVILNEILQSLPFAPGKAFLIKQYNPGKAFLENVFRVAGAEQVRSADGRNIDAWVIEMEGAAVPTTIWISKRTQEEIMIKSVLKDGSVFWRVRLYMPSTV